jgi:hypothetical protein
MSISSSKEEVVKSMPNSPADLAIFINAYKNVSLVRELTEREWLIVKAIEEKFITLARNDQT